MSTDDYVPDQLQIDLLTVIARIEQAASDPDMAEFLLDRMATCDAPRLRSHLTAGTVAWEQRSRSEWRP